MRTFRSILFLAILGVALSACASSGSAAFPAPPPARAPPEAPRSRPATPRRTDPAVASQPNPVVGQGDTGGGDVVGAVDDAKIVRTGTMDLEVSDVPAAVKAARTAILAMGGYVGASNAGTDGDTPFAEISYRIPSDRWEDALADLRVLGGLTTKIVSEQTQAVEVTSQVVDLEARIRNLQASETAFQGIAAKATKISDVLEIQSQLTNVRGEIEQLQAQLKDLNDRASYATVTRPLQRADRRGPGRDQGLGARHGRRPGLGQPHLHAPGPDRRRDLVRHRLAADAARPRRSSSRSAFAVARRLGVGRGRSTPPTFPPTPPAELPAAG